MFHRTKLCRAVLVAMGGGLVSIAIPALAQEAQRVEVTGSSIKRIEGETAAPVQIIRREEIARTGATSVEQLMRSISSMNSSQATTAGSSSSATTGGISDISMRGLTSERTLVLINGKRSAPYGSPASSVAVDVDSIPIAAIERIEVLKDGASAIYGSDAIAGVVNFILRKDVKGVELSAGYGAATQDGKGSVTKFSAVAGFGDLAEEKFNVMVIGTYQKDSALFGRDRDFAATSIRLDKNNFGGSSRSDPGNIFIPFPPLADGSTDPRARYYNPRVNAATGQADCGPNSVYLPEFDPNTCSFDTAPFVGLIPKIERMGLQLTGRLALGEEAELYGDVGWTRKKSRTVIQPSPIDSAFGSPFTLTPDSPFYPRAFVQGITGGATPDLNVRYRPFIIGNRDLTDTADNLRLVFGSTGVLGGWDYDASLLHTASQVKETLNDGYFRVNDDASGPGIVPLLGGQVLGTGGTPLWVNPFGENSADVIAAAQATNFRGQAFKTKTSLTGIQGKISKDVMALAGGGLALALGGELRREGYKLDSAAALGTGNIAGYGGNFVSLDTKRNVYGVFAELSAPVIKKLELGAAVRYDRYAKSSNPLGPDVTANSLAGITSAPSGDTLPQDVIDGIAADATGDAPSFSKATGKLGLRYQALPELLLRTTVSTGFRAPSLLDLYGPVQAGVSAVTNDPALCRGANAGNPNFCATQFNVYSGGNSRLKPEKSTSFTLGFVAEPINDVSIGIDYFVTKVKDKIDFLDATFILQHEDIYGDRVTRGPSGEIIAIDQRQENIGQTKIHGFDFDLRGAWRTGIGRIGLGLTATYFTSWKSQNPDGSFENKIGKTSGTDTGYIPRFRSTATAVWGMEGWEVSAAYNWQSGGKDLCGNLLQDDFGNCPPGSSPTISAYETMDAQVRYLGFKNFELTLGVRNLFDKDPPYVNGSGGAFQAGYDPTYVDPRGRFLYINGTYKF